MIASLLGSLLAIGYPSLDITASGLDYWVAWRTSGWELTVRASSGPEVSFPNSCTSASLTIEEDSAGVPGNLIVMRSLDGCDDSSMIYSLDPATLATLGCVHVPYAQICPPAREHWGCSVTQLEAQSVIDGDTDCVVFARVQTNYTLSSSDQGVSHYTWQSAAILDIEDSGQMIFREPAAKQMLLGASFISPVQTGPSYWISGWGLFTYYYLPVSLVEATGYSGSSGSGSLDSWTLDEDEYCDPNDATAFCAGNCSAGAVIVWLDSEDIHQYSLITSTSSPVPDTTQAMPPWPDGQPPLFAAMSDIREDPGALLAWYDGERVWCRYFDGLWNDWCYPLSPAGPIVVDEGFLGVCSAQDGYYVAWLEHGSPDPTVVYVPRSGVEGMEGSGPESEVLQLQPSENPFASSITLFCGGSSIPDELSVFDMTGRLVRNLTDRQGSSFIWDGRDGCGSVVPTGTYLIQGEADGQVSSIRVVKL